MIPYFHTFPRNARFVKRTWGKHCNVLLFVSGNIDGELEPFVPEVNSTDKWALVHFGLLHAFRFYGHKIDWFLRVEDTSFVVLENLRFMIDRKRLRPSQPIYFGYELENIHTHKPFVYCKSGYVLSHEALRRYTEESNDLENFHCMHMEGFTEDLELSRCLRHVNVTTVDSRDELGHETFIPIQMTYEFLTGYKHIAWLQNLTYHKVQGDTVPISKRAIAFRTAHPPEMYSYYYFVYGMKIFGLPAHNSITFGP
ncbi:hypothetical protein KR018_004483 [Drosophila ironensis]|nr:hypothetical protein KR018_004483 [Drosophila ironensis]